MAASLVAWGRDGQSVRGVLKPDASPGTPEWMDALTGTGPDSPTASGDICSPRYPALAVFRARDGFDELTRLLARGATRRRVLKAAVWAAMAVLAGALRPDSTQPAADCRSLTGTPCWPQDQVSHADQRGLSGATPGPGICLAPTGTMLWNGHCSSTGGSSARILTGRTGQTRDNRRTPVAPPRSPARTSPVQTWQQGPPPPRSTQAGPPSALTTGSRGPDAICMIGRRGREGGVPLGPPLLWPPCTRGPPRAAVVAAVTTSLL
jgi:hypothetical protein